MRDYSTVGLPLRNPALHLSFLSFALHAMVWSNLGFYADELYFLDCAKHLDFGYVDLTPFVGWITALARYLFGETLWGIRFFPALSSAITTFLCGEIARILGARFFGVALASFSFLIAPAFLRVGAVMVIPTFEVFFWTLSFYFLIRILLFDEVRLWVPLGISIGLGLMNKPTMILLPLSVLVGMLIFGELGRLKNRYFLYAVGLVFLICLPNLVWQIRHDFVTLRFILDVKSSGWVSRIGLREFLFGQVIYVHPLNAMLWLSGIFFLLFHAQISVRPIGLSYPVIFLFLVLSGSKLYYLLPIYPVFLAAGAKQIELWSENFTNVKAFRYSLAGLFLMGGVLFLPIGIPILSLSKFDALTRRITFGFLNTRQAPELFQMFRDMEGKYRNRRLSEVSDIYHEMPKEDQPDTAILVAHYYFAGAINLYRQQYDIPAPISGNVSYHLWGPRQYSGTRVIAVDLSSRYLSRFFLKVAPTRYRRIYLCSEPKAPLKEMWPDMKILVDY